MKFTVEKDELQKEVLFAQKVITEKSALSAAASVFIEARDWGGLLLRATGLNTSFETAIPADVEEAGAAAVFCEKLRGAFLAEPASAIECEKIRLEFTEPRQALTIGGADGYLHVVMPMPMGAED